VQANRRVAAGWKSVGMDGYRAETYGEEIADVYDDWIAGGYADSAAEDAAGFLAALAPGGRALELGIGTGRVALPLARRGAAVHGIDASAAMVARLRAKPGGADLPVSIGDFAQVPVDGPFDLVYVVFNTFFALASQDDQLRCARNVAARLRTGGRFVVEAFVPDPTLFDHDQRVEVGEVGLDRVRLDVSMHDRTSQTVTSQHIVLGAAGPRLYPVRIRYCWPSELDLICRLADLHLTDRWAGWRREPFNSASDHHVSVYTKA
jgi:SAM-dependent methyltransferase